MTHTNTHSTVEHHTDDARSEDSAIDNVFHSIPDCVHQAIIKHCKTERDRERERESIKIADDPHERGRRRSDGATVEGNAAQDQIRNVSFRRLKK